MKAIIMEYSFSSALVSLVKSSRCDWSHQTNHAIKTHAPRNNEGSKKCWGNLRPYYCDKKSTVNIKTDLSVKIKMKTKPD